MKDVDEELVKIILKTQSISYIMQSTLYTTIVLYLVENGKEILTHEVVNEQNKLGLFVEAGSLLMMSRPTSQSFHTLSNALHLIKSTLFSSTWIYLTGISLFNSAIETEKSEKSAQSLHNVLMFPFLSLNK